MAEMKSFTDRFWAKVDRNGPTPSHVKGLGPCWTWTASRNWDGYGQSWDGERLWIAHRFAWTLVNGPIPDGLCVLHRCDNPPCVRPDHLFLGTNAVNVADRERKGRGNQPAGGANGRAKLTEAAVREIRRRAAIGESHSALGRAFGVSNVIAGRVVRRETWAHVLDGQEVK